MAHQQPTFMTLPPELRERIYEFIALSHTPRRIQTTHNNNNTNNTNNTNSPNYKTTTSAISATCRVVHHEYETTAKKTTTAIEFTATDLDFKPVIDFFCRHMDATYLATLQRNKATIHVKMVVRKHGNAKFDIEEFYTWALFLIGVKMEAAYHSDFGSWMDIFVATDQDLEERCVVEKDTHKVVRDNIEEIRNLAGMFDKAMWLAYSCRELRKAIQVRRHRTWDRRVLAQSSMDGLDWMDELDWF